LLVDRMAMKHRVRDRRLKRSWLGIGVAVTVGLSLLLLEARGVERVIRIEGAAIPKTPVAILGFTRSGKPDNGAFTRTLKETLTFDLDHSGFFETVPSRSEGEILVKADYRASGGAVTIDCHVYDSSGKHLFGKRFPGKESNARRVVHRMADTIVKERTGFDGIASTRIVFVADRGGRYKNLCLVDYDGENLVQVTNDKTFSLAPDWSPDGRQIYYTSYLYGYPRVCTIDRPTGKRWVVSAYPGLNAFAAISPRGNEMVLTLSKDGAVEIYRASLEGKRAHRLTRSRGGVASSPCWHPNGTQIAFVSNRGGGAQIYAMNTDGSNVRRLVSGFSYVTSLDWSPTGDKIAFSARSQGRLHIFVLNLKSRRAKQVTFDSASHENPSFAPNGIHLAYVATRGYESDLYVVDTQDTRSRYRLTSLKGDETYPSWSPAGF
jgi:TolB protein